MHLDGLLAHLFPPFDAWWPNIIASMVWGPVVVAVQYMVGKRRHERLEALVARLHRHHGIASEHPGEG